MIDAEPYYLQTNIKRNGMQPLKKKYNLKTFLVIYLICGCNNNVDFIHHENALRCTFEMHYDATASIILQNFAKEKKKVHRFSFGIECARVASSGGDRKESEYNIC